MAPASEGWAIRVSSAARLEARREGTLGEESGESVEGRRCQMTRMEARCAKARPTCRVGRCTEAVMWSKVYHACVPYIGFQVPGFWVSRNQRKPVETRKLFGKFPDEERKQEANVGGKGVMVLLIWIK